MTNFEEKVRRLEIKTQLLEEMARECRRLIKEIRADQEENHGESSS